MEVERERERGRGEKERERKSIFPEREKISSRVKHFSTARRKKRREKGKIQRDFFFFFFFLFPRRENQEFSQPGDVSARKQPDRARFDRHRVSTFVWVENAVCFQDFSNGTLVFCLAENVRPVKIFLDVPLFSVTENVIRCRVY